METFVFVNLVNKEILMISRPLATVAALAVIGWASGVAPAAAHVIFSTGNQQYDNVNIMAGISDHSQPLVASVDNNPWHTPFYIANPHDGSNAPIPYMHGSHGAAAVEAWRCSPSSGTNCESDGNPAHVALYSFELYIEPGWAITGMDWKLDDWANDHKDVTFQAYDLLGNLMPVATAGCVDAGATSAAFEMGHGENGFRLETCGGESISKLVIRTEATGQGMMDIKAVSVQTSQLQVPEPASLALTGHALAGLALLRRRMAA